MLSARVGMAGRIILGISAALALTSGAASIEDMAAGKTPAQLFNSDCSECHRNPASLARGRDASTLASFLSEHYTTKSEYARAIAAYVAGFAVTTPPSSRVLRNAGLPATSDDGRPIGTDQLPPRAPGPVAATPGSRAREGTSRVGGAAALNRRGEVVSPLEAISGYLGSIFGPGDAKPTATKVAAAKVHHAKPHRHRQDIAEPQAESAQEPKIAAEPPSTAASGAKPGEPLAAPPPGTNSDAEQSPVTSSSSRRQSHRRPRK
jgi:hypothetical protein